MRPSLIHHREKNTAKSKAATEILKGLAPHGWLRDVMLVYKPDKKPHSGNSRTLKTYVYDILSAWFENE